MKLNESLEKMKLFNDKFATPTRMSEVTSGPTTPIATSGIGLTPEVFNAKYANVIVEIPQPQAEEEKSSSSEKKKDKAKEKKSR